MRHIGSCVARGSWGIVVSAVAFAGGCTICPSPFDYSGPVPNGSVTQNDFCARSGGTRPLRSSPLVWPPVVKAECERGIPGMPTELETPQVLVASRTEDPPVESVLTAVGADQTDGAEVSQAGRLAPGDAGDPLEAELLLPGFVR